MEEAEDDPDDGYENFKSPEPVPRTNLNKTATPTAQANESFQLDPITGLFENEVTPSIQTEATGGPTVGRISLPQRPMRSDDPETPDGIKTVEEEMMGVVGMITTSACENANALDMALDVAAKEVANLVTGEKNTRDNMKTAVEKLCAQIDQLYEMTEKKKGVNREIQEVVRQVKGGMAKLRGNMEVISKGSELLEKMDTLSKKSQQFAGRQRDSMAEVARKCEKMVEEKLQKVVDREARRVKRKRTSPEDLEVYKKRTGPAYSCDGGSVLGGQSASGRAFTFNMASKEVESERSKEKRVAWERTPVSNRGELTVGDKAEVMRILGDVGSLMARISGVEAPRIPRVTEASENRSWAEVARRGRYGGERNSWRGRGRVQGRRELFNAGTSGDEATESELETGEPRREIQSSELNLNGTEIREQNERRLTRRPREEAVCITVEDRTKRAQILAKIRAAVNPKQWGLVVSKVKETRESGTLIEVSGGDGTAVEKLREEIQAVVAEEATVKTLTPRSTIELKNVDSILEQRDIIDGLVEHFGDDVRHARVVFMRQSYGGGSTVRLVVKAKLAAEIVRKGKFALGWTLCTAREVDTPLRCLKCHAFGHKAAVCKASIDRSDLCLRCARTGHVARDCENEPRCVHCCEDLGENGNHAAGSKNCRGRAAQALFLDWSVEVGIDIAIISEQYRNIASERWFADKTGKCAIYLVNKEIKVEEHEAQNGFVAIKMGVDWLIGTYLPPNTAVRIFREQLSVLSSFMTSKRNITLLAGDFNARSRLWGNRVDTNRGRSLEEIIEEHNMLIANNGRHTFKNSRGSSAVDVTLGGQGSGMVITEWNVQDLETLSDHLYVTYNLVPSTGLNIHRSVAKWNRKTLDREICALNAVWCESFSCDKMECGAKAIKAILTGAADASMKRFSVLGKRTQSFWWNDKVETAKKAANKSRRKYLREKRENVSVRDRSGGASGLGLSGRLAPAHTQSLLVLPPIKADRWLTAQSSLSLLQFVSLVYINSPRVPSICGSI
ncbi:uncharacterized protein [Prorops nasuta]|uniref:uncharacterized protein n=1 Tax=Prorops nasuta TaxID=863751 RepID=UPI0034CD117B